MGPRASAVLSMAWRKGSAGNGPCFSIKGLDGRSFVLVDGNRALQQPAELAEHFRQPEAGLGIGSAMTLPDVQKFLQLSGAPFFALSFDNRTGRFLVKGSSGSWCASSMISAGLVFVHRVVAKITSFACKAGRDAEKPIGQVHLSGFRVAFGPDSDFKCLGKLVGTDAPR